jgi:hypothetical protein
MEARLLLNISNKTALNGRTEVIIIIMFRKD